MDFENIIGRIAEQKIQEAIEEGKFDNLPGKGKPLVFDDDPGTPMHLRMVNKILKNANVLPEWIQIQKEILAERAEVAKVRERLIRDNKARCVRLTHLPLYHNDVKAYAAWHAKSRALYLRQLKSVNNSILKFSLTAPTTAPAYKPYKIEMEMAAFDEEFTLLPGLTPTEATSEPAREGSLLQGIARTRYQDGTGGGAVGGWNKAAQTPGSGVSREMASEDIGRADVPDEWKKRS